MDKELRTQPHNELNIGARLICSKHAQVLVMETNCVVTLPSCNEYSPNHMLMCRKRETLSNKLSSIITLLILIKRSIVTNYYVHSRGLPFNLCLCK